jgi:hypothetical protein
MIANGQKIDLEPKNPPNEPKNRQKESKNPPNEPKNQQKEPKNQLNEIRNTKNYNKLKTISACFSTSSR